MYLFYIHKAQCWTAVSQCQQKPLIISPRKLQARVLRVILTICGGSGVVVGDDLCYYIFYYRDVLIAAQRIQSALTSGPSLEPSHFTRDRGLGSREGVDVVVVCQCDEQGDALRPSITPSDLSSEAIKHLRLNE